MELSIPSVISNFLSLVWAMLSGLKNTSPLPKYTPILNQRTEKIIEPLLNNMLFNSLSKK